MQQEFNIVNNFCRIKYTKTSRSQSNTVSTATTWPKLPTCIVLLTSHTSLILHPPGYCNMLNLSDSIKKTHLEFNLNSKCEHLVIIFLLFRYDLFKYTCFIAFLKSFCGFLFMSHPDYRSCDCLFFWHKTVNFLLPFLPVCLLYSWSMLKLCISSVWFLRQQLLGSPSDMHMDLLPSGLIDFDFPILNLTQNEDLPPVRPCCLGRWHVLEALILFGLCSRLMQWHLDGMKTRGGRYDQNLMSRYDILYHNNNIYQDMVKFCFF